MRVVFHNVFGDSPDLYVQEKLRSSFRRYPEMLAGLSEAHLEEQAAGVLADKEDDTVPITPTEDFYQVTQEQMAEIEARQRCALAAVMRESPLLEGETIEKESFTYLQEPYGGVPAGTPVLHRLTNKADLYYLFDDTIISDGDLLFIARKPVMRERFVLADGIDGKAIGVFIGKELASGLIGGIAGKIGGAIFDAIFPPGVPDYFDEVYKEIRNIVKEEVAANTIEVINGRINGTVAWFRNTYMPRKAAGVPREELSGMITNYVNTLYTDAVYTLMEPRFAKPGLTVFIVAAGVHMTLMQEQALVDPHQPDPTKSSYATSIKLSAQEYSDHVNRTFDEIYKTRREAITIVYDPYVGCAGTTCYTKGRYRWNDSIAGKRGALHEQYVDDDKKNHTGAEEAEADRVRYENSVLNQLTADLGTPKETANKWLSLKTKPIPSH